MATYKISGLTLETDDEYPQPGYKWACVDSGYDGAPDSGHRIIGNGDTEIEAIYEYLAEYVELGLDKR